MLEHDGRISEVAAPHIASDAARYFEYGPRTYLSKRAFARGSWSSIARVSMQQRARMNSAASAGVLAG
ncbi:hypothetical protein OH687_29170 [Burkholderia anthina]|nr:hypothetical protein OH687_29170 [Burkholderia anthina]